MESSCEVTNGKVYFIGLFGKFYLQNKDDKVTCCILSNDNMKVVLVCNKSDHSLKLVNDSDSRMEDMENEIERGVVRQLCEDGSRWEGDWYNEQPFGFGSVYDGEGNRIYSGFMFEGKKIGFGTEYFADNNKVDYCGNFMNGLRHGWGTTYDRNGNTLYEGDWRFGKNDFEERIVIRNEEDCLIFHDLIKELEFGEDCFNEWKDDLAIENYPNLERIIVKENSLKNLNSLKICNCEKLKTIEIEDGDWKDGAFCSVENVIIESIL